MPHVSWSPYLLDQSGLVPGKLLRSVPSNDNISRPMQLDCELAEQRLAGEVSPLVLGDSLNALHLSSPVIISVGPRSDNHHHRCHNGTQFKASWARQGARLISQVKHVPGA